MGGAVTPLQVPIGPTTSGELLSEPGDQLDGYYDGLPTDPNVFDTSEFFCHRKLVKTSPLSCRTLFMSFHVSKSFKKLRGLFM